jgi:V8-like Glu-specific endopeptidase
VPGDTTYPYDTVVYITDTIGGLNYQGSGVLIAPNVVLTAAHVVWQTGIGRASNIEVSPGFDQGYAPFGTVAGTYIQYEQVNDSGDLITAQQSQFDYAVIKLAQSFDLGTMGLRSDYAAGYATVTGYPASAAGAQVTQPEYIDQLYPYTVYAGTALGPGSSGGPVWIDGAEGPQVVGLVSSGDGSSGTFTQITNAAFNTIEGWAAQDAACFAAGTRIATARGDIAVEHLQIGDSVRTRFAGHAPVVWLGHRRIDCRRHPQPDRIWPVRIARGAFGPGRPARDLWLSPDHAVLVAGQLVPVRHLLNGATIAQVPVAHVTYWHVELPRHDAVFAEGLAAESYLDTGNRHCFDNGGVCVALHADFAAQRWQADSCAPLLRDGPRLAAIRHRLHAQARRLGHATTDAPALRVLADAAELPLHRQGDRWHVRAPRGCATLRLRSRIWVPAQMQPDSRDMRRLGIAIGRLWRDECEIGLDSPRLAIGWHTPESGWRWTDGDAHLPLDGARSVAFTLAMAGRYWCAPAPPLSRSPASARPPRPALPSDPGRAAPAR